MMPAMVVDTVPPTSRMAPDATSGPSYFSSPTSTVRMSFQGLPGLPAASMDSWELSTLRSARSKATPLKASMAASKLSLSANRPTASRFSLGEVSFTPSPGRCKKSSVHHNVIHVPWRNGYAKIAPDEARAAESAPREPPQEK